MPRHSRAVRQLSHPARSRTMAAVGEAAALGVYPLGGMLDNAAGAVDGDAMEAAEAQAEAGAGARRGQAVARAADAGAPSEAPAASEAVRGRNANRDILRKVAELSRAPLLFHMRENEAMVKLSRACCHGRGALRGTSVKDKFPHLEMSTNHDVSGFSVSRVL